MPSSTAHTLSGLEHEDGRLARGRGTRDRLLATARTQFGQHGYEATSIDTILSGAGVARGALYHHFASKEALFEAVLDQVIAELAAKVRQTGRAQSDPAESLKAGSLAWLRLAIDPAVQRIVLLDAPAVVGWNRWRTIDDQHTLGATKAALALLAQSGRLPYGSTDMLAHLILAAVGETALLIARADDPATALPTAEAALELLLDRLLPLPT
ncbi:MAG: TetR/AcrR family transcriptional regulator [Pseudonocardiales bacterium]|nr:TetR/AcrR family transcriptional regulator [Pseudonocardiales bacterium]